MRVNRRNWITGAHTAEGIENRDVFFKLPWMALQRPEVVCALKVARSHPCDRDIRISYTSLLQAINNSNCTNYNKCLDG